MERESFSSEDLIKRAKESLAQAVAESGASSVPVDEFDGDELLPALEEPQPRRPITERPRRPRRVPDSTPHPMERRTSGARGLAVVIAVVTLVLGVAVFVMAALADANL